MIYAQDNKEHLIFIDPFMARDFDAWERWVKREYPKRDQRPNLYPVDSREQAEGEKTAILELNPQARVTITQLA